MANNELLNKIEALNEWEALMEEARAEAEAIKDEIKQEMLERGTEELVCGQYIIRYQSIVSNRFDSSAFKKALPDVYKAFIRQRDSQALHHHRIRKAPCLNADQSHRQETSTQTRQERARTV